MAKFNIVEIDADLCKKDIIFLWGQYLPDTPPQRFEWMNCNPAGPPDWFLAFDEKTQTIAGSISIMPKIFNLKGQTYRAGIIGDLIVKKEYQVFGPSLSLLKTVIRRQEELKYDFLYTLPNHSAEKICLRAGFTEIGISNRYVNLLRPGKKVVDKFTKFLPTTTGTIIDFVYKLISRETYTISRYHITDIDNESNLNRDDVTESNDFELSKGKQTLQYVKWKYFCNPLNSFKLAVYKSPNQNRTIAKAIYTESLNNLYIYDFWNDQNFEPKNIIMQFLKDFRRRNFDSISIRLFENSPLSDQFVNCGFKMRNDPIPVLYTGKIDLDFIGWHFFDGDRNI